MIYIMLLTVFLVLITILSLVIYAFNKLPRSYFFFLFFTLITSLIVALKIYERNFKLSVVPDALQVNSIAYSKEKSWGFGPGGNEAGIRVYPLSEKISNQIKKLGIEYFETLPANENQKNRRWRGIYDSWSETPVKEEQYWKYDEGGRLDVYDYICRYGFCINIDEDVLRQATDIINSEGSYYAYGRIGLIVISPRENIVLYVYNG